MITRIDHWIAFVLLGIIGSSMIKESREDEEEEVSASFDVKTMLALAVATSIDALAVGVHLCISPCKYRLGGDLYRLYDVCPVSNRGKGR